MWICKEAIKLIKEFLLVLSFKILLTLHLYFVVNVLKNCKRMLYFFYLTKSNHTKLIYLYPIYQMLSVFPVRRCRCGRRCFSGHRGGGRSSGGKKRGRHLQGLFLFGRPIVAASVAAFVSKPSPAYNNKSLKQLEKTLVRYQNKKVKNS